MKKEKVPEASLFPMLMPTEKIPAELGRPKRRNNMNAAQEVMYHAWEEPSRAKRMALAKKALGISPDCADAYVLLAEESSHSVAESTELYGKAVQAGERAIGKKKFAEYEGHFWGVLETRPYMRARAGLARCLWEAGKEEEAAQHYREMLRLNPNDNQGIRYVLLACLMDLHGDEEASRLLAQYEEDDSAEMTYTAALLAFRENGDTAFSRKKLRKARKGNPFVQPYLVGEKRIPRILPDYVGIGDESEAVGYAGNNVSAWKSTPGAIAWLQAGEKPKTRKPKPVEREEDLSDEDPETEKVLRLMEERRFGEAEAAARQLGVQRPDDSQFPLLQGVALMNMKKIRKARKVLARALGRFPDDWTLLLVLGGVYAQEYDLLGAETAYAKALTLPGMPLEDIVETHCLLADVQWGRHNRKDALEHWQKALELDPDNEEAKEAIADCTNEHGEPKSPTTDLDDFHLFKNIHLKRYYRLVGREEFISLQEAELVMGLITKDWNTQITPHARELDVMSSKEKTKLFEGVTVVFSIPDTPTP